ncbi:PEP-CTERM sorting domain-containing protein [Bythopirellula polymerisocia]|uniref:PEP-CTERM protein-sorting domain-containing protein n=1 Tax=Bythopirellula polymerisocia TaxID=2528003 RepID=A0A5C6CV80_9BACT|nr:PEP-CTERM sorting domain-containing protein [Bythopirellula polymerisocia]TWU28358.1 hypothetical protein Pla144_16460 [Bythopirellula polymerisocia]
MRRFVFCNCLTALTLVGLATASYGVTIVSENFDPLSGGAALQVGYTFGDTASSSTGIGVGAGLTGDSWQTVNTTAANGNGFSGVGAQYQNGAITGNTSSNLSDYTLSFDAKADGGSLNIQIETFALPGFGGGVTGKLNTAPDNPGFGNDQLLNNTYTHYDLNLGDTAIFMADSGIDMSGGTIQITFQFNGTGAAPFTQALNVDNLKLTMIPEPMTASLFCTGMLALIVQRRRKS